MSKYFLLPAKATLIICLIATLCIPHAAVAQTTVQQLDALVQQWLTLEQQHSQLQQDWLLRKQSLQQGIALLQAEQKQLQQLLQRDNQQHDAVDEKRNALLAQQQQLEQQQQLGSKHIALLLQQVQVLQPQLPPPLQQLWQQELDNLPDNADSSQQLQRSLLLLSKLAEFQQRLNLDDTTLTTAQGQAVRVKVLYLGASQAWFASADGSYAGSGNPHSSGWHWQFDNSVDSTQVLHAIAMVEKRTQAALISLPIQLSATPVAQSAPQEQTP